MSPLSNEIVKRMKQHPDWKRTAKELSGFKLGESEGSYLDIVERLMLRVGIDITSFGDDFVEIFSDVTNMMLVDVATDNEIASAIPN